MDSDVSLTISIKVKHIRIRRSPCSFLVKQSYVETEIDTFKNYPMIKPKFPYIINIFTNIHS